MESLEHALKRGASIIAEYLGGAATCDAHHMTDPRPDGLGVWSCITKGLLDARISPEEVTLFVHFLIENVINYVYTVIIHISTLILSR